MSIVFLKLKKTVALMDGLKNPMFCDADRVIAVKSQFPKPWNIRLNSPEHAVPSAHSWNG